MSKYELLEQRIITTEQSCILTRHYFGPFRIIFAKGAGLGRCNILPSTYADI